MMNSDKKTNLNDSENKYDMFVQSLDFMVKKPTRISIDKFCTFEPIWKMN